jgi:hypothetical protein
MKNIKHTPGPWAAKQAGNITSPWNVYPENKSIDFVAGTFGNTAQEQKANAHLISAAPDMFDALQAIVDAFGDQDSFLIDQCKAALDKAKSN